MKKKFTFLVAALMLLTMISQPTRLWGQSYVYTMITNLSDVTEGVYVIGALRSTTATDNFYFATTTISSGDINTTSSYLTVQAVNEVRSFDASDLPSGAKEFTFTGNNTDGFTIANGTDYLYFTANSNRRLAFASNGSTYKWKANSKTSPLITGGVYLSYKGNSNYTISENSTAIGAIRGYANTTSYRAIYLFKKEASTDPTCTVDPETFDFEGVHVGQSSYKDFTVTTTNLVHKLDLAVYDDDAFTVSPTEIAAGETSTTVRVTFSPNAVTTWEDGLVLSGDDFDDDIEIPLFGEGLCNAPATALAFPPYGPLTYDGVSAATQELAPSTGTGNGNTPTYTMKTNPSGAGSIVNGSTFSATGTGTFIITATQALNGTTCGDVVEITIVVNGTAPSCEITPSTGHNFGAVLTNTSESFDFSVAIANLEHGLTLSVPSGYEVYPPSIAANASSPVNVTVTFTPTAATAYNGSLTISGDDFDNDITAALSGTGDAGYTVTFNPYSGTCDPTSIRVATGGSIAELPTATADGATFYGWATSKVASTTTEPTSSIVSAPYTPTGNVTLHAVYKIAKEFDNTAACAGSYTIYSVVETGDKATTNYYATGTLNKKYSSTTTASDAKSFTLTKVSEYGNDEWAIKDGNNYVAYSGSTDLTTQSGDYKWIITQGVKGTWRITAESTLNSTIRGFVFQAGTTNKFGGYALSNLTPGAAYYDIEFGGASFTYNSETPVAKPTYNLAGGSYAGEQSVTISCTTPGATIYYTTNGSDPTASSTEYTDAITVNETMTIKAVAIKSGMANSTVAYATYSIVPLLTTMDQIFTAASEIGGTADNVAVSFDNWVVSGIAGSDNQIVYVTDNGGKGFIIYKYTNGFAVNDKLYGTVAGTPLKLSEGSAEFTGLTTSAEGLTVTHDGTITPVTKTISQLTSGVNTGAVVTISNLAYDGTNLTDGSSNTIRPNTSLYDYSSVLLSEHDYSSVTGVFVMYNSTKQIHPRSAADIVEVEYNITLNDAPEGCTIGTDGDITTAKYGQTVTLTQSAGPGYRFISWSVNSGAVTVTNNQFTMPKGNVTVTATFAPTYAITVNVTPENTGTVTANPNPAIEGETVTLTIEPEDGYALKSITAYKTGASSTPVTITDNTITMPSYGVTVAAEFATEHSVTYNVNGGTGAAHVDKYGAGANVTVASIQDEWEWTAPTGKIFTKWTTNADGTGTEYQPNAVISEIADNYDLYAQWRNIVYHVSFSVNGVIDHDNDIDVAYNTAIGSLPEDPELAPLTFLGWSSESATGATDVTASWKPTGENEDVTVYAVFGTMGTDSFTLTGTTTSIPTGYGSYTWIINTETYFHTENVMQGQYSTSRFIQYKKASGYIYNDKDFGKITSIVLNYYTGTNGGGDNRDIKIKIHGSIINDASTGTEMTSSGSGTERTFTYDNEHYDYHYFRIYNSNSSNFNTLSSIQINFEDAAPLTVNIIDENTNMSTDIEETTCVVVKDGATLNFTGANNGNANNLIIEDGGQLIVTNTGVQATVKKTVENSTAKTTNNWYAIATSTHDASNDYISFANVDNIAPGDPEKYNVYKFDEVHQEWDDCRDDEDVDYDETFTQLDLGCGYLFRSTKKNGDLIYQGEINTATNVKRVLSYTAGNELAGLNFLGNPYSENITISGNVSLEAATKGDEPTLVGGYVMSGTSGWNPITVNEIAPNQGFLVQIDKPGYKAVISKPVHSGKTTTANNDYISFKVTNSEYEDVTYAWFDNKALPLTKINHRNSEIPMLYIPQNGEDFAIAMMSDDTKAFNLNFEAKTAGRYTLNFKANGEFNYLHVIDRMTGEDVDMLLEGEYSFIGSPMDNPARFIVRLGYLPNYDDNGEDIFAYQNGSDIVVSGEGELQIFDVMGRMVSAQRVNGVETINLNAQGVYIFKLNEKTQKIVVK